VHIDVGVNTIVLPYLSQDSIKYLGPGIWKHRTTLIETDMMETPTRCTTLVPMQPEDIHLHTLQHVVLVSVYVLYQYCSCYM
jgi:hypothetical protein